MAARFFDGSRRAGGHVPHLQILNDDDAVAFGYDCRRDRRHCWMAQASAPCNGILITCCRRCQVRCGRRLRLVGLVRCGISRVGDFAAARCCAANTGAIAPVAGRCLENPYSSVAQDVAGRVPRTSLRLSCKIVHCLNALAPHRMLAHVK